MPRRRDILATATAAGAFLALRNVLGEAPASRVGDATAGFGALHADPEGILDLPGGIQLREAYGVMEKHEAYW